MFSVFKLVLIIFSINLINSEFNPEEIYPCAYHPISEIHCTGPEITDEVLKKVGSKLGNGQIRLISINNTEITSIPNNLTQAIIENIFIEYNLKLTKVDPKAFITSPAITGVLVRHNPLLVDPNVLEFVKYLDPDDTVDVSNNSIKEIPANAFMVPESHKSKLKHINLSNNNITSIGANAFLGHSLLELISLNDNEITRLDNNSLSLTYSHAGEVMIFLSNNSLNSESFPSHTFGELQFNVIKMDLENNKFVDFPESTFKPFLNFKGSQAFLYNNTIKCDCNMKWLLNNDYNHNVLGLYCDNLKKSFSGLTDKDLGCY